MENVYLIKAELKIKHIYTCHICGKQEIGATQKVICFVDSSDELKQRIDDLRQTSHYMPIGWSYNGRFDCGCKRNQNKED